MEYSEGPTTVESFKDPFNNSDKWILKQWLKPKLIEPKTNYIMIFPKELPSAALGCAIMNGLESQNPDSNIIWKVG